MAFRETSSEEKQVIAEGAVLLGNWCEGKPLQICLATAVSFAARLAARLSMDEGDFIDYVRRNLRDAKKSRELQRAVGPYTGTILDGERRILLPREAGEVDPL
jgi:hypothetical protein